MKRLMSVAVALLFVAGPYGVGGSTALAQSPSTSKDPVSFRDVVKQVLPGVVSIEPQTRGRAAGDRLPAELLPGADGADLPERPMRLGAGSGFVIDPSGVVVTNYHVVRGADQVEVRFKDGRKLVSRNIKTDPKTDLAIIRLDAKEPLPALQWADSAAMEIGDRVLAVGAPYGLDGTVTHGIVSGKGRSLNLNLYEDFVQTDAAINPGNSGGPLVNLEGKVIGVNSVIKSRTGGFQGVGLAISSQLARKVIDDLIKTGAVQRAYLGVRFEEIDLEEARQLGLKEAAGALVTEVVPDAPAAKAGIRKGDVITAIASRPVKTAGELPLAVASLSVGKPTEVALVRDGKPMTLQVTAAKQAEDFGLAPRTTTTRVDRDATRLGQLGIWVGDLTRDRAEQFGYEEPVPGAVILRAQGLAATAGIRPGWVITKIGDHAVSSAKDAEKAAAAASLEKGVEMEVRSPEGGTSRVMIRSSGD